MSSIYWCRKRGENREEEKNKTREGKEGEEEKKKRVSRMGKRGEEEEVNRWSNEW